MKVRIFNYDTKELINEVSIKEKDIGEFFKISRTTLSRLQATDDILKIGKKLAVEDWGFDTVFQSGLVGNTMSKGASCVCYTGPMSYTMGSNDSLQEKEPTFVRLWNPEVEGGVETTNLRVGFIVYMEGFVLSNGRVGANILGGRYDCYIASIGSRNIRTGAKNGAKVFKDKKAVLAYLEKHKDTFKFCVKKYDYKMGVEPTCDYSTDDYTTNMASKKEKDRAKDLEISEKIMALLEEINIVGEVNGDGYDDYELPKEVTEDAMQDEVLYRMKKYDLWDVVVRDYVKTGKVYMSEGGGIIYDLDETAKKAVEEVVAFGYVPFHVVHTVSGLGNLYQVLFVSNDTGNWRYERGRKDGYIYNYCYNESCDDGEYGESQFISCNGGMQRIA